MLIGNKLVKLTFLSLNMLGRNPSIIYKNEYVIDGNQNQCSNSYL